MACLWLIAQNNRPKVIPDPFTLHFDSRVASLLGLYARYLWNSYRTAISPSYDCSNSVRLRLRSQMHRIGSGRTVYGIVTASASLGSDGCMTCRIRLVVWRLISLSGRSTNGRAFWRPFVSRIPRSKALYLFNTPTRALRLNTGRVTKWVREWPAATPSPLSR